MTLKIGANRSPAATFALPLEAASEANAILATRGAGKSYLSADLIEELYREHIQVAVLDPTGVYWGLRASADGKKDGLAITILGGAHGDVPLDQAAGALIADVLVDTGQSLVIDLSDFPTKAAQTRFVTDFAERLYRRKAQNRTTLHVVIDEADEFVPQRVGAAEARMVGAFEQIVKRGRSRGLGVTLITQRSQAINKSVLDLIETLIVMRMLSPRSVSVVKEWITAKDERDELGILDKLPSLPTGEGFVWSPLRATLERVTFRRIRTFDSFATPKPGETRVLPEHLAAIDVAQLGEQIAATAERAKESDPKALRARVAQLERELAERPVGEVETRTETVEVPVEVEVPVLTQEDRACVAALAGGYAEIQRQGGEILERFEALVQAVSHRPDTPKPAHTPIPLAKVQRPRAPVAPSGQTNGKVSGPQQRILDALAWFEAIGVNDPRRPPLAAVAGVSSKSSGFRANVSTLSGLGLVQYGGEGRVSLTADGRMHADIPDLAPTRGALHDAIYRMVSRPQADILRVLIDAYDEPMTRQEIADAVGVSSASSGFRANISTLSGLELVCYPGGGTVVAAEILFP